MACTTKQESRTLSESTYNTLAAAQTAAKNLSQIHTGKAVYVYTDANLIDGMYVNGVRYVASE